PAAILGIVGLEVGPDQAVLVRSGAVGTPGDRAVAYVERRDPAARPELVSRVADEHLAVHHERRHGDGRTVLDAAELRAPHLLAGLGVRGHGFDVQEVVDDLAVETVAVDAKTGQQVWRT